MLLKFKLAVRNIFRNRRRSILSLLMIGGAVSAVLIYDGFTRRMVDGLRETTIKTQTGHLQVANKSYWNKSGKLPKDSLIPNSREVIQTIRQNRHVRSATGRLSFYGLMTLQDRSISAQGVSFDSKTEGHRAHLFRFIKGKKLSGKNPYQVALGSGLAKKLKAKVGASVVVMTQTLDGVVNALDLEVSGIFETAISEFDDRSFLIPLLTTQTLMDTKGVEQIVVFLDHFSSTIPIQRELQSTFQEKFPSLSVKPWFSLAALYNQVSSFNKVQNRIFQTIIFSLVLLGILNTVSLSVLERTGEMGTIRALGDTRGQVLTQFVLEGFLLGVMGAALGLGLGFLLTHAINSSGISLVLPGASTEFILEIWLNLQSAKRVAVLAIGATVVSSLWPAMRAVRISIVGALRQNV